MELRDYLRVARRRWTLIVTCVLVAVAAAAIGTMRMTPQYDSTARLFVSTPQTDSADAYTGGLFSQERVLSYADLITGEQISQQVVDRLSLDIGANDLSEQLTSSVATETVILEVTATDTDPQRAQRIAAAAADEFTTMVPELEKAPARSGRRSRPRLSTVPTCPPHRCPHNPCATSGSPQHWACCWASASPSYARCSTPR